MAVKVYSKNDCVFCERAKKLLTSRQIPFKEFVLGQDVSLSWIRESFPLMKTFPIITNNEDIIGGYDDLVERLADDNFGKVLLHG
jgi:thioredoxin reductase (NADPH)